MEEDSQLLTDAREVSELVAALPEPEMRRKLRRDANISQERVARHVGVSAQTYRRYERGERTPKGMPLLRLLQFYDACLAGRRNGSNGQ